MSSTGAYRPPHLRGQLTSPTASPPPPPSTSSVRSSFPFATRKQDHVPAAFSRTKQPAGWYHEGQIRDRILGGTSHTFVQCAPPIPNVDGETGELGAVDPALDGLLWRDTICRIMIHQGAHLSPPGELWTRHRFELLETNKNKHIAVFMQLPAPQATWWEYLGRWEIQEWTVFEGGSEEVHEFVCKRAESKKEKTEEAWASAFGQSWARVKIRKAEDQSFGNPMETSRD